MLLEPVWLSVIRSAHDSCALQTICCDQEAVASGLNIRRGSLKHSVIFHDALQACEKKSQRTSKEAMPKATAGTSADQCLVEEPNWGTLESLTTEHSGVAASCFEMGSLHRCQLIASESAC